MKSSWVVGHFRWCNCVRCWLSLCLSAVVASFQCVLIFGKQKLVATPLLCFLFLRPFRRDVPAARILYRKLLCYTHLGCLDLVTQIEYDCEHSQNHELHFSQRIVCREHVNPNNAGFIFHGSKLWVPKCAAWWEYVNPNNTVYFFMVRNLRG